MNASNEVMSLALFIQEHGANLFDGELAAALADIGEGHNAWAAECSSRHYHDEVPCPEFERGLALGIAWLKARVVADGPQ